MRTHLMLRGRRRTVRLIARSSRNCATRPEPKPLAWASVHECALSTRQLQSSRNCQPTARSTISNDFSVCVDDCGAVAPGVEFNAACPEIRAGAQ